MKDQAVKLRGPDVNHVKAIKRKFKFPTAEIIGAAVYGFRFLSSEQQLAAFQRQPKVEDRDAATSAA